MLQAGGGALWVEGKDEDGAARVSALRNSPKRSGLEQGWASGSAAVSRRGSNGSAAETSKEQVALTLCRPWTWSTRHPQLRDNPFVD